MTATDPILLPPRRRVNPFDRAELRAAVVAARYVMTPLGAAERIADPVEAEAGEVVRVRLLRPTAGDADRFVRVLDCRPLREAER